MTRVGDALARAEREYHDAVKRLHWELSDRLTADQRAALPEHVREALAVADAAWRAKDEAGEALRLSLPERADQ